MKIQEGKYYRTRDGRKVGPMGVWYSFGEKFYDCKDGWGAEFWQVNGINDDREALQKPEIDLVAEWEDTEDMTHEDTPKIWKDMTDEEKGALLLAHHEGKEIEFWVYCEWIGINPFWLDDFAYRVKPEEPKRETVTLYGSPKGSWGKCKSYRKVDTHKITFDLIDGVPDCDSISMEEI